MVIMFFVVVLTTKIKEVPQKSKRDKKKETKKQMHKRERVYARAASRTLL